LSRGVPPAGFKGFASIGKHILAEVPLVPNLFEFAEYVLGLRLQNHINANDCKTIAGACVFVAPSIAIIRRTNCVTAMERAGAVVEFREEFAATESDVNQVFNILNTASLHLKSFFEQDH
jgi:hypothetical protein